jgi:hypothetical protein
VPAPRRSPRVTWIDPGFSLHDLSALMSPMVSREPSVSMQIAGFFDE